MKSFFKKLAFVMALAMVVSLAAPAAKPAFAATEFTYAEQESGAKVTTLNLKIGEEVDLKFKGVADYKSYPLKWVSADEEVATVDQRGVVTAVANGTTTVELQVGDGTVYTSQKVVVNVDDVYMVALGTAKDNIFDVYEMTTEDSVDLNFYGIKDWTAGRFTCTWESYNESIVKVDPKGVVTPVAPGATTVVLTIVDNVVGTEYFGFVEFSVSEPVAPTEEPTPEPTEVPVEPTEVPAEPTEIPAEPTEVPAEPTEIPAEPTEVPAEPTEIPAEEITAQQTTATKVVVTFTSEHTFDLTGADADGEDTVKVYRVFSTDEMAQMSNKNGLKFDEEGNGYQAHYVKLTEKVSSDDLTKWVIEGYNTFTDNATYAVVYGPNETSSTIKGIMTTFVAHVGKVHHIVIEATDATVENEVEPAISAVLTTKLYNEYNIDLTDYYKNAEETDYELVSEDIDVSVSGNEVTFDEVGVAKVKGTYTFYDEDLEEDVPLEAYVDVKGTNYSTYRVEKIYNWTLSSGYKSKWSATSTNMIAGDEESLYVIVVDNRGNYYSNVPGIENENYYINGKKVLEIGNDDENTAFEQYGYELVFDSLDPDSLLVDADGVVTSYKKTNSFAVVSYRRKDDETSKLRAIGVMGITVDEPRRLDSVKYTNGTSFTILKETEAEDDTLNAYDGYSDFKTSAVLKVEFLNQYGKTWADNAEDWNEAEPSFTVTTTKEEFKGVAESIADALTYDGYFTITAAMFEGSNTTSVSFKIKERATGDSETVTIKLDKPKYETDANGNETDVVYVDPAKATISASNVEMYLDLQTSAKLFQVSKATQKIGYFRIGDLEMNDEGRGYYVANELTSDFTVKVGEEVDFVSTIGASSSALTLNEGDYVLVVTDPSGKIFPAVGEGGNGKSFGAGSNLGVTANADGTAYEVIVAAEKENGEMEYAANGTYRVAVYKITNIAPIKNTTGTITGYKYNTSRISSDSFTVSKTLKNVSFYHQKETKNVELEYFYDLDDIKQAISETMTFKINGQEFEVDENGWGRYKSYMKFTEDGNYDYHNLDIAIADVDYKIQADNKKAVINTVTFKVYTPAGGYYLSKVKVNRSVNAAE